MALSYVWCAEVRTFVMASTANGLKAVETVNRSRRLIWGIGLAILITFAVSIGSGICQAYSVGVINMDSWFFQDGPQSPYKYFAQVMRD